jgi:hypothetical protein
MATKIQFPTDFVFLPIDTSEDNEGFSRQLAPPFKIKWLKKREKFSDGLSFEKTKHLMNELANNTSVNMSRNCQEISAQVGKELCALIDQEFDKKHEEDNKKRLELERLKQDKTFFILEDEVEEKMSSAELWTMLLQHIETNLGKVLMATYLGSKRYNLNVQGSDQDMFIVILSPVKKLVGFSPFAQSIKNPDGIRPDYTIYGIEYYLQLVLEGDTKSIESLFQTTEHTHYEDPLWIELKNKFRHVFLTKQAINKYMIEVMGNKGQRMVLKMHEKISQLKEKRKRDAMIVDSDSKHLDALQTEEDSIEELEKKLMKKWYILFRCLVHAKQAATTRNIEVWLPNDSKDREFLLKVRGCQFSHEELNKIFTEQVEHVEKALESYTDDQLDNQKRLDMCKDWYFHLRKTYEDNNLLAAYPHTYEEKIIKNKELLNGLNIEDIIKGRLLFLTFNHADSKYFGVYAANIELLVKSLIRPNAGTNPWTEIDLLSSAPANENKTQKGPVQSKKGKEINKFKLKERELLTTDQKKPEISQQNDADQTSSVKYTIIEVRKFLDHVTRLDLTVLIENLFREQVDGKISVVYEHELWTELRNNSAANICKNNSLLAQCQGYIVGQVKRIKAKEKMKNNKNANNQPFEVQKLVDILNMVIICVRELQQSISENFSNEIFDAVNKALEFSRKGIEVNDEFEREMCLYLEAIDRTLTPVTNMETLPKNINTKYFNQWLDKVRFFVPENTQ